MAHGFIQLSKWIRLNRIVFQYLMLPHMTLEMTMKNLDSQLDLFAFINCSFTFCFAFPFQVKFVDV